MNEEWRKQLQKKLDGHRLKGADGCRVVAGFATFQRRCL